MSRHQIRPYGRDRTHAGRSLLFLEEVDSTNSFCLKDKRLLETPGLVVAARRQRAGRGSKGRQWLSGKGGHLFCSFVIHPVLEKRYLTCMSLFCGLAVRRALIRLGLSKEVVRLKWPNDVMIQGKKAAGILCELSWLRDASGQDMAPDTAKKDRPVVVAGIGVNVQGSSSQFPEGLRPFVTTLEESGLKTSPEALLEEICQDLDGVLRGLERSGPGPFFREWNRCCFGMGEIVVVHAGEAGAEGRLMGLDEHGLLVVEDQEQGRRLTFSGGTLRYLCLGGPAS